MRNHLFRIILLIVSAMTLTLNVYARNTSSEKPHTTLPNLIVSPGEKVIIVDPRLHQWGAYDESGQLVKSGLATAGSDWCRDLGRSCHTKSGSFRIYSLGDSDCKSHKFPLPRGGAPMPYCMHFHNGQALHGAASHNVIFGNASHGCVRMHVEDARWVRYHFVEGPSKKNNYRGTLVYVRTY